MNESRKEKHDLYFMLRRRRLVAGLLGYSESASDDNRSALRLDSNHGSHLCFRRL